MDVRQVLQVFVNKYLLNIVNIHWPDRLSQSYERKMTKNQYRSSWDGNETGLDTYWKNWWQHRQAGTTMAISRPQRKRVTHECLTKSSGKNVDGGLQAQLEEDWGGNTRQNWTESSVLGLCSTSL